MRTLRLALAQINTAVGDLHGNCRLIADSTARARALGADIVAFPELAVTGYPPEDLVLRETFVRASVDGLRSLAAESRDIVMIVGFVDGRGNPGQPVYNAAGVLAAGGVAHVYRKHRLPNYGVFDERRYFTPGSDCPVLELDGALIGVNICEDVWTELGPSEVQCAAGAQVIVNINASPFEMEKHGRRTDLIRGLALRNRAFATYTNQVGGQDELVFDGTSLAFAPDGSLIAQGARFEDDLLVVDLDLSAVEAARAGGARIEHDDRRLASVGRPVRVPLTGVTPRTRPGLPARPAPAELEADEEVYRALVLGTRDYARKTGFNRAVIALSGGIDSSLTAVVAIDALGADNVVGVAMPSRHSSEGSVVDAAELAKRLSIPLWRIPIEPAHRAFEEMLAKPFAGSEPNLAEENVQSRIRGTAIMTISNKFGWLVLTTGNKSEMATGYATLYGDMAGGFAVLKDVPKTLVYRLAHFRNRAGPGSPISAAVIEKPPSAELRPGQLDQDSLPPYEVLDRILALYIEEACSFEEIAQVEAARPEPRADDATIRRVLEMVNRSEYKRRQAPPGVKVTGLAFGRDRRLPIASRFHQ